MSSKPSKTKTAMSLIIADVAEHGQLTREGMRHYVENRMSKAKLDECIRIGNKHFILNSIGMINQMMK